MMFEPTLQLSEIAAKDDLPQIAADLGSPHNRLEKETNDVNVQCYLEKLEDMLKHQDLMLVDLLKAMRKIARKGTRVPPRHDEHGGRPWPSVLGHVRDSKSIPLSRFSTDEGEKYPSQTGTNSVPDRVHGREIDICNAKSKFSVEERNYPAQTGRHSAPHVWRFPTGKWMSTRRNIWRFLEDRNSGRGAKFIAVCSSLIALSNTIILFFDLCYPLDDGVLWALIVCHFVLAAEFLVRFLVAPSQTVFMCNMPNIFEIISLIVFSACFANWAFTQTRWHEAQEPFGRIWIFLPPLMMMRAVRRFKIFQLLSGALKVALKVLPVLVYSLGIIIASFAAIIMAVEPRENVATYGQALWLVIVTVFTVGYFDIAPSTDQGRQACAALMMITCLYMAIPIGIVGTAFTRVWEDKDRLMALQDLRDQISWAGLGVEDTLHIFEMYTEGSLEEGVSLNAFKGIILSFQCKWRDDVVESVFNLLDEDGCGSLDIDEFLFGLFPTQRFFWKQAVEKLKKGYTMEILPEEDDPKQDRFRPNGPEKNRNKQESVRMSI